MSFMYEGHPSADQLISGICSNAFASGGATTYLMIPSRAHIMECGFQPITASVTSTTTLQVKLGDNAIATASNFGTVLVTSGTGTFASTVLPVGGVASVALSGSVIGKRGDALEYVMSGGNSATLAAQVYAIIRRAASQ